MLNSIKGTVTSAAEQRLVVDCGPWSLSLQVPDEKAFQIAKEQVVLTYMHWNQEQGPALFGFVSDLERTVFLLIISCSGLGPKIALSVIAHMGVNQFLDAVSRGDDQALSRVNGIGAKKAEQMIVQLKHKVEKLIKSGVQLGEQSGALQHWNNVADVLTSLNYTRTEVARAMKHLSDAHAGAPVPFDHLMRQALSFLSKKA